MKDATELLKEQEKSPVWYHIYCYFDKLLSKFNQPYVTNDEPGFMLESCRAGVMKGQFDNGKGKDLVLTYLGKFDLKTGKFDIFDEALILLDIDKLLGEKEDVASA